MMMNMKNIHQMLSNVSTTKTFDLHETIKITEILSTTTSYLVPVPKLLIFLKDLFQSLEFYQKIFFQLAFFE